MEHAVVKAFLEKAVQTSSSSKWADLGAGSGAFTKALAELLGGKDNVVYAIDMDSKALAKIPSVVDHVKIEKLSLDFVENELPLNNLDGILMANSFHYVKDKEKFIKRIKKALHKAGRLVIVEYDTLHANRWVPYPINFVTLKTLMTQQGFDEVIYLYDHPSIYHDHPIYAALVK